VIRDDLIAYLDRLITERRRALFDRVLAHRTRHLRVLVDDPADPSDASAVMRSCECFGIQEMHVVARTRPFEVTAGVAVGSAKWVTVHVHGHGEGDARTLEDPLDALASDGYQVVAIDHTPGSVPIDRLDLEQPTLLCFGSGSPSAALAARADRFAHIPTAGFTQTFNISVRASLVLATLTERLHDSDLPWRLTEEAQQDLRLVWLCKMTKRLGDLLERFCEDKGIDPARLLEIDVPEFQRLCRKHGVGTRTPPNHDPG